MFLRNMSFPNYSDTPHTRKGIKYSIQLPLRIPNVCQPLTIQEAEKRILLEGKETFNLSQGDEATSNPQDITHSRIFNATNNSSNSNIIA